MKIPNDLRLKLDNPNWAVDPELVLVDTILKNMANVH